MASPSPPAGLSGLGRHGSWEALWAVVAGLVLAGAVGLAGPAWLVLMVVVGAALYWKVRPSRERSRRRA